MSQATRRQPLINAEAAAGWGRGTREGLFIGLIAFAVFLLFAFISYDPRDPGWSFSGPTEQVVNHMGIVGAWFADVLLFLCGYLAYLFPILFALGAFYVLNSPHGTSQSLVFATVRGAGFAILVASACGLSSIHYGADGTLPDVGGILGNLVGRALVSVFNLYGTTLVLVALLLTGISLYFRLSWLTVFDFTGSCTLRLCAHANQWLGWAYRGIRKQWQEQKNSAETPGKKERRKRHRAEGRGRSLSQRIEPILRQVEEQAAPEKESGEFVPAQEQYAEPLPEISAPPLPSGVPSGINAIPPLELLDVPSANRTQVSKATLEILSREVEFKLKEYGVDVEVVGVYPGPVVTRFELQPAPGLKVSKISSLAKDLARSLSMVSVRVVEVIPGKSVIGLELPNESVEMVALSEILRSRAYEAQASVLTLALGKDIAGRPMVLDLGKMPHLLVAGTTGSGKSVAINAMVLSLLYKSTPEEIRLIMVDPKMLELSVYEGIGHLLAPVVTDMKDAHNALRWCVAEMERRYKLMSLLGVRHLAGYNQKLKEAAEKGEPIRNPIELPQLGQEAEILCALPSIVVVIDELADLMMTSGKKVEELIARLAQKARAAGIHLILATQRPSVDVITGLIKANIPSRIGFQVSSKIDSRTILDQGGAEQLLGHGDMLYLTPGMPTPIRVHGAYVSDQEVHRVVRYLKAQSEPNYVDAILNHEAELNSDGSEYGFGLSIEADAESDPLYDQAVAFVTETRRASISGVQRRLKVGYNRAARMIEQMEHAGIVGPVQANGSREITANPPPAN